MNQIQCYNCGDFFDSKDISKEHVPAKNLFNGYPEVYKQNRITVSACFSCNNKYSEIDQELRDAIGILNDSNSDQSEITRQAVKSVLRKKGGLERLEFLKAGGFNVSFNYAHFVQLNKKNFKALFFKKYGCAIDESEYNIQVICEGDEDNPSAMRMFGYMHGYLTLDGDWSISGHEDIFQYRMKSFHVLPSKQIVDTPYLDDAIGVCAILVYHKTLASVVFAIKKTFKPKLVE